MPNLISRRAACTLSVAALTLAGPAHAFQRAVKGVRLGVGTYSFRGLPLEEIIRVTSTAGATGLELDTTNVEPALERDALRQWRLSASLDDFKAHRVRMHKAGLDVYAYSTNINDTFTDAEIDALLRMTKALGASIFNTAVPMSIAKRLAPFAERHKIRIGLHPSGNATSTDSIQTGASYLAALELSPWIGANPDLYLCRNWGPDPIAFVRQIHGRITSLHFHDRKTSVNPQVWVPFGEGDLPTKELLLLAKKEKYRFPFTIERIYTVPNIDHVAEIRRCLDYCKNVLA